MLKLKIMERRYERFIVISLIIGLGLNAVCEIQFAENFISEEWMESDMFDTSKETSKLKRRRMDQSCDEECLIANDDNYALKTFQNIVEQFAVAPEEVEGAKSTSSSTVAPVVKLTSRDAVFISVMVLALSLGVATILFFYYKVERHPDHCATFHFHFLCV